MNGHVQIFLDDRWKTAAEYRAYLRQYDDPLCIVDEIQKIPALLDEVHELIESRGIR